MTEEKAHDRVNMNWPVGLKDQVQELVGARGVTKFAVEAVQTRLSGEDTAQVLTKEVDELRYFTQLVLDRYVMGGEADDRHAFLMELDLPAWVRTDGWPTELAKLVPALDPVSEPVLTEEQRRPTQPPAPITGVKSPPLPPCDDACGPDEHVKGCHQLAMVPHAFVRSAEGSGKVCMAEGCIEGPDHPIHQTEEPIQTPVETPQEPQGREHPSYAAPSSAFLERVQARAAEKGIDFGEALTTASNISTPAKPPVHNHAWVRGDDDLLRCDCGAMIEGPTTEHPTGIVREPAPEPEPWPEPTTEPASALEVPAEVPTPVAPPAPVTRSLDDFDVDF